MTAVTSLTERDFTCDVCRSPVAFENVRCLSCDSELAFSVSARRVVARRPEGERRCRNHEVASCNWLAGHEDGDGLCLSCRLTRTRPNDADTDAHPAFVRAEAAKRRLVYQLLDLGLPVVPWMDDADAGLAVDLLSSRDEPVVTGHADGVITLDLAEGDDPHREAVRISLGEPYRTLLGHLRHESGHYYWQRLAGAPERVGGFRELFGDERADYQEAVERHYDQGPPVGWESEHVSAYATMHPWEDWAETFAHYLHLRDMLQTADSYGLRASDPAARTGDEDDPTGPTASGVQELVDLWLPLSYGLNAVNRSMGKADLYPFVLTPRVIAKLDAVHAAVLSHSPDLPR